LSKNEKFSRSQAWFGQSPVIHGPTGDQSPTLYFSGEPQICTIEAKNMFFFSNLPKRIFEEVCIEVQKVD
jgi:hypothetical protein